MVAYSAASPFGLMSGVFVKKLEVSCQLHFQKLSERIWCLVKVCPTIIGKINVDVYVVWETSSVKISTWFQTDRSVCPLSTIMPYIASGDLLPWALQWATHILLLTLFVFV